MLLHNGRVPFRHPLALVSLHYHYLYVPMLTKSPGLNPFSLRRQFQIDAPYELRALQREFGDDTQFYLVSIDGDGVKLPWAFFLNSLFVYFSV